LTNISISTRVGLSYNMQNRSINQTTKRHALLKYTSESTFVTVYA